MSKILVTGGLGFIGSHTCVELLSEGYEIVVMDNCSNGDPSVLDQIERISGMRPRFYLCDLLDFSAVAQVFREEGEMDAVIHFAALKAVGESVQNPLAYYQTNVTGTLHLLKAMEEVHCECMVFSSSATVYGMDNPIPYTEEMPTSATSPYGYTKVANERILMDLAAANPAFRPAILRYFNPIGAHPSGLIGESPKGIPNNLLPYIMDVAIGSREALQVFGQDYDTPDGTGVRDYIHVVDLAKGHVAAVSHLLKEKSTLVVNLGTGVGSSVLDVVRATEKVCGNPIPLVFAPRRAGDIDCYYADTQKAKEVLNWEATRTLEDMCRDSWNFIQKRRGL